MSGLFAEHALELCRAGFAVVPAKGKAPIRRGFNRWPVRPSERTVVEWAERPSADDIVFVAGLCGDNGIVAVDCDDADAIGQGEKLFGPTPGTVSTRRGEHCYYRADGQDLGKLSNLRPYGLNIDLKHGNGGAAIIAAPPTVHKKDAAFHYDWINCGPDVIRDFPPFSDKLLRDFLDKRAMSKAASGKQKGKSTEFSEEFRDGSRKQELNDYLVRSKASMTFSTLPEHRMMIYPRSVMRPSKMRRSFKGPTQFGNSATASSRCLGRAEPQG